MEKKEKNSIRWVRVNRESVVETSLKVTELTEGNVYLFRVSAENKAGVGEPSQPTVPTLAKLPYSKSHRTFFSSNLMYTVIASTLLTFFICSTITCWKSMHQIQGVPQICCTHMIH